MGSQILLMDGVTYAEWTSLSHEELTKIVKKQHRYIFGEASIYFDIKARLRHGSTYAIPDGYCLTFDPDTLWVIEVELSTTDRRHLVGQLNDFINGLGNQQAQRELRDALHSGLSEERKNQLRNQRGDLYPWLERLIASPSLVVITERATSEMAGIVANLRPTPSVRELRTFRRVGAEAVHIHQFGPLYALAPVAPAQVTQAVTAPVSSPHLPLQQMPVAKGKRVTHAVSLADMLNARLVSPGQRIFGEHPIGKVWHGEILASGQVRTLHDGAVFRSLSGAAGQIRKYQVDGWTWWKTKDEPGQVVELAQLREKLERRQP